MQTTPFPATDKAVPEPASRWKRILFWTLASLVGVSVILAAFILISYETFRHFYARAPDPLLTFHMDPRLHPTLPVSFPVEAALDEAIPIRLTKVLETEISIRQDLDVWIDDDFIIPMDLTLPVPIDQEVYVETEIPVETLIPLEGAEIQTGLWGIDGVSLPLKGSIPVKILIPFRKPLHVKTRADIRIQEKVKVRVRKQITVPLDLKVQVKLPIDETFSVRFPEGVKVNVRVPQQVPVDIPLRLNFSKRGELTAE